MTSETILEYPMEEIWRATGIAIVSKAPSGSYYTIAGSRDVLTQDLAGIILRGVLSKTSIISFDVILEELPPLNQWVIYKARLIIE